MTARALRVVSLLGLALAFGCGVELEPPRGGAGEGPTAVVAAALSAPPDASCVAAVEAGRQYWFCPILRSWSSARQKCLDVGLDLAAIESSAENTFIRNRILFDTWIGATDQQVEGAWIWRATGQQFWQGNAGGSRVGNAFVAWGLLEPSDLGTQDCGAMQTLTGLWLDNACADPRPFVCEGVEDACPNDPLKVAAGACGCGNPETDSDGDGTPDCVDGCDHDPEKIERGTCGCGEPDADTDADGTLDCRDECPEDPKHVTPGQCGCLGESNLQPAGTACFDGLCSLNDECDGSGSCGTPQECAPQSNCTVSVDDGHAYAFCPTDSTWVTARSMCQSVPGMDLVHIGSAHEDSYVHGRIPAPAWIGANDRTAEGAWVWADNGQSFWTGSFLGGRVNNSYANWAALQPDDVLGQDCAVHRKNANDWLDEQCTKKYDYVCEIVDFCLSDATKQVPGQCGCGVADTDTDGDGVADCNDACPSDAARTVPGDCGCANAPLPAGTACDDGACGANTLCDGAGSCGTSAQCTAPDSSCTFRMRAGIPYWFCANQRSFDNASARCLSAGMQLVSASNAGEDAFIGQYTTNSGHTYLGASDRGTDGSWYWLDSRVAFWQRDTGALDDAYLNWEPGEGCDGSNGCDCMAKDPVASGGEWEGKLCTDAYAYVCEGVPAPGTDLEACVESIQPRADLEGAERDHAFQMEIQRRCTDRGGSACLQDLRARVNLDYNAVAIATITEQKSPAQYLAVSRDRARKARRFESDAAWAAALCTGTDDDGDFIINPQDNCPGTPPLTPTDDAGCPDTSLPNAPSMEDVKKVFDHMGFPISPACSGARPLPTAAIGPIYRPTDPSVGIFIYAGRVSNQPVGCPVWYIFDMQEVRASNAPPGYTFEPGGRYVLTFMDIEESTALAGLPRPVPPGLIQFNTTPSDPIPARARFGTSRLSEGIFVRYRVKMMNGAGMQSGWSAWRTTTPDDCTPLGLDCGQ